MKKILFSLALAAFAVSLFAASPAVKGTEKVILDGFKITTPAKPQKGQTTKEWVKGWGLAGVAGIEKGAVALKHGVIYGFCVHVTEPRTFILTVKASAPANAPGAKLTGYFSTCVRKPGDKKPFIHEKRTVFGPFALTAEAKEYKVEYNVAAHEQGYLYIGGENVNILSVRIVSKPVK